MVFFAIWWAWMNFTWFASAYDCDDVPYRLLVFVQIAGALIMAAGVTGDVRDPHAQLATIAGYVVMRLALVAQWLRAARRRPRPADHGAALCVGHHPAADRLGRAAVRAWPQDSALPLPGAARAGGARVGRARRADDVAPTSHRRALRPAHADRAGRVDPRGDHRGAGRAGLGRGAVRTGAADRRRAADRVLDVVDLLRPARCTICSRACARPSCGATATTWSLRRRRPSAPGWRSPSTRPRTTRRLVRGPLARPWPFRSCSS